MRASPIHYTLFPANPAAHLFEVSCTVADPDPSGQRFSLPAWIPGSYMIREFARNIISLHAESNGRTLSVEKLDKHTWRVKPVRQGEPLTLRYTVYAWDLSVRAAHLDQTHGFFNGPSVFLAVEGKTDRPCRVALLPPKDAACRGWRVATALSRTGKSQSYGFGNFQAADYDELIDHPVEMGNFTLTHFCADGVRHDVAITGRHDCDVKRLTDDLLRICNWQIALFGAPPPMDYYAFLTTVVGSGYGGLEHRASCALLASRTDLPWAGMEGLPESYINFLGLCSHEYFHTWNVKRIKPAAFTPYDLSQENYTRLLWVFEGFTSYYDDLTLVRSGIISIEDYLLRLGKTISAVLRGSGRLKQSVAESSFDAWIKYYRQDENAPNAIVSYYAKGALIALALDLKLRELNGGKRSLDTVMRTLWHDYGVTGTGVIEEDIFRIVAETGNKALARWLKNTVEGTTDLPLARLLKTFGVEYETLPNQLEPWLGVKLAADQETRIATVYDHGPAQKAGLSAGDALVAIDGIKVDAKNLSAMLGRRQAGDSIEVYAFRRDELMRFQVDLEAPPANTIRLALLKNPPAAARRLRKGWLDPDQ